jgi:hypothetical protein
MEPDAPEYSVQFVEITIALDPEETDCSYSPTL